jgi:Uri superfamily endonuclease
MQPGAYIYVGSAFGPGGLRARVSRHLRRNKKIHWHIDYLRQELPVLAVWYAEGDTTLEHTWAKAIGACNLASMPVPGFGASDCRCASHLFYCGCENALENLCETVGASCRQCAEFKCLKLFRPARTAA